MSQFIIAKNCWYAWQMIPGYAGERSVPYCSPIYVTDFKALKSGGGTVQVDFVNVFYAQGVQDFSLKMRVLKRASDYLIADLGADADYDQERSAVISHIEFEWIRRFCPELWYHRPPSSCAGPTTGSVSVYLDEVFLNSGR
jgi:hypothetical protein